MLSINKILDLSQINPYYKNFGEINQNLADDIPKNDLGGSVIPDVETHNQVYQKLGFNHVPRNYNGYSFLEPTQKYKSYLNNGEFDPNVRRAEKDPDSALPTDHINALQSYMPESIAKPHNDINLIEQAKQSYINYANRFKY